MRLRADGFSGVDHTRHHVVNTGRDDVLNPTGERRFEPILLQPMVSQTQQNNAVENKQTNKQVRQQLRMKVCATTSLTL
jgi:hypothetical protein